MSISCRVREGFVMRLAIVGTAAAAAIGGTLAVAPLTLSTPERVAGGHLQRRTEPRGIVRPIDGDTAFTGRAVPAKPIM
ncbi:hypothetical protein GR255_22560, partial [Mycobacterium tuberculosis]|nr:hypothetical protein [Mycobacterium tuberculosis]